MPTVPLTKSQTQTTQPSGARLNVRADATDFGATTGRAVSGLGDVLAQRALRMKENEDTSLAKVNYRAASDALRETEAQLRQRQGVNSYNVTKDADIAAEEIYKNTVSNLGNDKQREVFDNFWNSRRSGFLDSMSNYEVSQGKQAALEEEDGLNVGFLNDIEDHSNDDKIIANSIQGIRDNIFTGSAGLPPEAVTAKTMTAVSGAHKAVVMTRLTNKNTKGAQEYYDKLDKTQLSNDDNRLLQDALKNGTILATVQSETDRIMAKHSGDERAQLNAAREIQDPEVREGVERMTSLRQGQERSLILEENRKSTENGWSRLDRIKDKTTSGAVSNDTLNAMLSIRDGLPTQAAKDAMDADIQAYANGEQVFTDWTEYTRLRNMFYNDPNAFLKEIIEEKYHLLDPVKRKELLGFRDSLRNSNGKSSSEIDPEGRSLSAIISQTLTEAKLIPWYKTAREVDAIEGKYWEPMEYQIAAHVKNTGKNPTPVETQEMLNKIIREDLTKPLMTEKSSRYNPFTSDEYAKNLADEFNAIPESRRTEIRLLLQEVGKATDAASIVDYYKKKDLKGSQ